MKPSIEWTEIINQQLWAELSYQEKTELDCLIHQIQADALRWAISTFDRQNAVIAIRQLEHQANQLDPKQEGKP
jgi:hypothetical protein